MILSLMAFVAFQSQPPESAQLGGWGDETLGLIERDYPVPGKPFLAELTSPGQPNTKIAFNWGVGVTLSAFNAAAQWNAKYRSDLKSFADRSRDYWSLNAPVPGYAVLPNERKPERFYDDNAWMALALVETSEILGDPKYLAWARETLKFVLSGEDTALGGGIYWKERDKTSKNTCSNAPAVAACMAIFARTRDVRLLAKAEELYEWTKRTLQDPDDHLMWDAIGTQDDHLEKTKWSYNTALMIRSAVALYQATGISEYLHDVRQMRVASLHHWLRQTDLALKDEGPFAHLLLESWIWAERIDPTSRAARVATLAGPLTFIHQNCRVGDLYGKRWDSPPAADTHRFQLIDQASAARAYFEAASFLK